MLTFADKIKIVCNVQSERYIFMYNAQLTYDRIDEMSKLRGISIGKIKMQFQMQLKVNTE